MIILSRSRSIFRLFNLVAALLPLLALNAHAAVAPYQENPYYWSHQGKPILLLGASRTHNLFQSTDIEKELDEIVSFGGNYVRNTMSFREEGDIFPYVRTDEGFDLTQFNPIYWERFEKFLQAAQARDIIVQIEVWDIWDFHEEAWQKNPFNPKNNFHRALDQENLPEVLDIHPKETPNPFFSSAINPQQFPLLLDYQEALVKKLLSISLKYPNVLYCVDNESFGEAPWSLHWAMRIRDAAAQRDVQVEITEMWEPWNITHEKHLNTIDHPEIYSFIDVSQNNHSSGQHHYDAATYVVDRIREKPRPINNIKIYGADTSHFVDEDVAISSFWKSLFAGHAAVRFHRRPSGLGVSALSVASIQTARRAFEQFDIFNARRCTDKLLDREDNEAYCLQTDNQLLLYFPKRKKDYNVNIWRDLDRRWNLSRFLVPDAEIRLKGQSATKLRWFQIGTGEITDTEMNSDETISPPDNEHWLLLVR